MKISLHIQPKAATDEPASLQFLSVPCGRRDSKVLPTPFAAEFETAAQPRARPVPRHEGWTPDRSRAFLVALPQYVSVTEPAKATGIDFPTACRLRNRDAGGAFHLARKGVVALGRRRLRDEFVSRIAREVDGRMATVNFVNFAAPALSSAGEIDAPMATVNFVNFIWSRRRRSSAAGLSRALSRLSPCSV